MAWTELYANVDALKAYLAGVKLSDSALTALADTVDQDIIDQCGPHSGVHTVVGGNGYVAFQPRANTAMPIALDPVRTHKVNEVGVTITDGFTGEVEVTYRVDGSELNRRRAPFIEMLKLRIGYRPQTATVQSGLQFSAAPVFDQRQYDALLESLMVIRW